LAPHFLDTARVGFERSARLVALSVSTALVSGQIRADERARLARAHRTALHLLGSADEPRGVARWWLPVLGRFGWSEPFYRTFVATEHAAEAVAVAARVADDVRLRGLLKQCLAVAGSAVTGYTSIAGGAALAADMARRGPADGSPTMATVAGDPGCRGHRGGRVRRSARAWSADRAWRRTTRLRRV
jgi:hypothetical protein